MKNVCLERNLFRKFICLFYLMNLFVYFASLYRILQSQLFWLRTVGDVIRMKVMKRLVIFLLSHVCCFYLLVHSSLMIFLLKKTSLMFFHLWEIEKMVMLWWQVLPNGTAWIPHLVKTITEVALNGSQSIVVDKKLIEGPNPNERGKFLIPLIFALQVSFLNLDAYLFLISLDKWSMKFIQFFSLLLGSISLSLNQSNVPSRMILQRRVDHHGRCVIQAWAVASSDLAMNPCHHEIFLLLSIFLYWLHLYLLAIPSIFCSIGNLRHMDSLAFWENWILCTRRSYALWIIFSLPN